MLPMLIGAAVSVLGGVGAGIAAKQAAGAKRAYGNSVARWSDAEYKDLQTATQRSQDKVLADFLASRAANRDQMKGDYEGLIADYDKRYGALKDAYSKQARGLTAQYEEGMKGVRATAAVGRTNTLAAIDEATNASLGRMQQTQAFTGLGGTSFGAAASAAEARRGALEKGVVEEQYAGLLAGIEQDTVQGRTALESNRINTELGIDTQRAGGTLAIRGQGIQNAFQSQEQGSVQAAMLGDTFSARLAQINDTRIRSRIGLKMASQQYAGAGSMAASSIIGGLGSSLGGALMGMGGK